MEKRGADPALGKAITIRRVEMGLSRNELRERCGLSYPYVAELEKGAKSPSARALEALATALEIRPHELLARAAALADAQDPPTSADSITPEEPRRWFASASEPTSARRIVMAPPPRHLPAPASQDGSLTEERVREIVREEVRRLLNEAVE